ncbi:protein required for attachment to host cells [Duganella sp. 1224]|uniref:host attachment protein n=1 Tax=Duganella sp. 1224 TaxID=2587052 RepID=UPI0015CCCD63|nr:host attachment protein [Duganella sp. 1224]NYE60772.1 protein required for attachment to host cells [Duganella sp. 1224]
MDTTLILAANAGRALFFHSGQHNRQLCHVHDMINDAARQPAADLETDRMGPTSAGQSMHNTGGALPNKTYQPAQTPAEHEAERFARDINAYLLQSRRDGVYDKLVLIAPPHFLGVLRQVLDPHVRATAQLEINKDYTQLSADELRAQIARHQIERG